MRVGAGGEVAEEQEEWKRSKDRRMNHNSINTTITITVMLAKLLCHNYYGFY